MRAVRAVSTVAFGTALSLIVSTTACGQPYGQGAYQAGTYGNGVIQVGPVILSATGAGFVAGVLAMTCGLAAGLYMWRRQRGRRRAE